MGGVCLRGKTLEEGPCIYDDECLHKYCGPSGFCGGVGKDGGPPEAAAPDAPRPDLAPPDAGRPDSALDLALPDKSLLCGNGKLDPAELCDGPLLGGKTCATQGFTGGLLVCRKDCTLDARGCFTTGATSTITSSKVTSPGLAAAASGFLASWTQSGHVRAAMFQKGTAGKSLLVHNSSGHCCTAAASDGKDYMVLWRLSGAGNGGALKGAAVTSTASIQFPVLDLQAKAMDLGLAYGGANFLAIWNVTKYSGGRTYGRIVTPQGNKATSISASAADDPGVAFDGTNDLVAWSHNKRAVHGRRVDKSGAVVDKADIVIEAGTTKTGIKAISVAQGGGHYLVVWTDTRNGNTDVLGAVVDTRGKVTDASIKIAVSTTETHEARAAYLGGRFVVVWRYTSGSTHYLGGTQVEVDAKGKAGVVHAGKWMSLVSKYKQRMTSPRLAVGGGGLMMAYLLPSGSYTYYLVGNMVTFGK